MQRCIYWAEGPYSSHHHSGGPRPGAPRLGRGFRGYGYALHTNTDNAPPVQLLAGGCGIAVLGATRGTPPSPQPRLAFERDATSGIAHPKRGGGGGDPSAKRPKRPRPPVAGETRAFKRGRVLSAPPPPREVGVCEAV